MVYDWCCFYVSGRREGLQYRVPPGRRATEDDADLWERRVVDPPPQSERTGDHRLHGGAGQQGYVDDHYTSAEFYCRSSLIHGSPVGGALWIVRVADLEEVGRGGNLAHDPRTKLFSYFMRVFGNPESLDLTKHNVL